MDDQICIHAQLCFVIPVDQRLWTHVDPTSLEGQARGFQSFEIFLQARQEPWHFLSTLNLTRVIIFPKVLSNQLRFRPQEIVAGMLSPTLR